MDPIKIRNTKRGPESIIQEKIENKLKQLNWVVLRTHGNMFQSGFPDNYVAHRMYGARWIEVKDPARKGDVFTPAQHRTFPLLMSAGVGIWVLTGDSDSQIRLIHGPPNWTHFLSCHRQA